MDPFVLFTVSNEQSTGSLASVMTFVLGIKVTVERMVPRFDTSINWGKREFTIRSEHHSRVFIVAKAAHDRFHHRARIEA